MNPHPAGRAHRLVVVALPLSASAVGSGETSPKRLRREGGPQESRPKELS